MASLAGSPARNEMRHAFWGPKYTSQEIEQVLLRAGVPHRRIADPTGVAVELLAAGKTVGWFQDRMEFGPRSLGNRSILFNPVAPDPRRVKRRDYLKPFGISILAETASEYLLDAHDSPFMSFMGTIRGRHRRLFESALLNNRCRYQSVGPENPGLRRLLERFREKTGLPFLVNTSLNPEGDPIVESPQHFVDGLPKLYLDTAILGDVQVSTPPPD